MARNPLEKALIYHVDDIGVASNELNLTYVANRNFLKLLDNDKRIMSNIDKVRNGIYRIMPWNSEATYSKNDFVWYTKTYVHPLSGEAFGKAKGELLNIIEENGGEWTDEYELSAQAISATYCTTSLFLLRSTRNNNTAEPEMTIDQSFVGSGGFMVPLFDASGWHNENPMGTIYTDYFQVYLERLIDNHIYDIHVEVKEGQDYHKFGILSAYSDMDVRVLKTDMSNLDPDRKGFLFPYHTWTLQGTNTILNGQARKWDCGLLEYTIEFKLGTDEEIVDAYNEDGTVRSIDQIDINYLNLRPRITQEDDELVYDNSNYYLDESDADIFKITGGSTRVMNGIIHQNTNNKLNALLGTIRFPEPFIDTNYTIFLQTPPTVCLVGGDTVEQNVNQMVFVNKSRKSVAALLIIPTYEGSEPKLLYTNRFRMQVSGRWKKTKYEIQKEEEEARRKALEEEENQRIIKEKKFKTNVI